MRVKTLRVLCKAHGCFSKGCGFGEGEMGLVVGAWTGIEVERFAQIGSSPKGKGFLFSHDVVFDRFYIIIPNIVGSPAISIILILDLIWDLVKIGLGWLGYARQGFCFLFFIWLLFLLLSSLFQVVHFLQLISKLC
jgi:hypothetical protein